MELATEIVSTEIKEDFFETGNSSNHQVVPAEIQGFERCVDEIFAQVTSIEGKVNEVENFYISKDNPPPQANTSSKCSSISKDKVKEKNSSASTEKQQLLLQDASSQREMAAAKRTVELIRQFAVIFRQTRMNVNVFYLYFLKLVFLWKHHHGSRRLLWKSHHNSWLR
jgi:hypothetical protein